MDKTAIKQGIAAAAFACIMTGLNVFVHWEAAAPAHIITFLVSLAAGLLVFFRPIAVASEKSGNKILHDLFVSCEWNVKDTVFFFVIFFAFLILYLPAYLALFPGTLGYDTPIQLAMYFGEQKMTAGNPIAHTLLLGAVTQAGEVIFGSSMAGFALYIILQWIIVSRCVAEVFVFLKRRQTPVFPMLCGFLWIILSSPMKALTFNATKDILFGAFLLLFMIRLAESLSDEKGRLKLFESALLVCLFRNPCIIILLVLCIFCFLFRIRKKALYTALLSAVLCSVLFAKITSAVFHIEAGGRTLALFVPAQQLGLTASYALEPSTYSSVNLSGEELTGIRELIPQDVIEGERHEFSADTYFAAFDETRFKSDVSRYSKLWYDVGMKNKGIYFHAYRNLVKPYFDAAYNPYRELVFSYPFPELNHKGIERNSYYPEYYERLYADVVSSDNIIFLLQPGIGITLGILLLIDTLLRKRARVFLTVFPFAFYFAGWLIGPVALLRYLYPLMIAVPFLLGSLFMSDK